MKNTSIKFALTVLMIYLGVPPQNCNNWMEDSIYNDGITGRWLIILLLYPYYIAHPSAPNRRTLIAKMWAKKKCI